MHLATPDLRIPPAQDPAQHSERPQVLVLVGVVLVHLLVILWVGRQVHIAPPTVMAPSVVGVLIAPEPKIETPVTERAEPAKPKPVQAPPKTQRPDPVVTEKPKAVTPEPAALPAAPAPTPAASAPPPVQAQAVSPVASPPAPDTQTVTPPRTDAAHLNNPPPAYPALSRRLGEQGRVLVDVYILPDGSVGDLKLNRSSGFPRLDEAAMTAVKKWKYIPAKRGGQPIAFWYVQPVSFVLNSN